MQPVPEQADNSGAFKSSASTPGVPQL